MNNVSAFNNEVDTGLRILCLLYQSHPLTFDLRKLVLLDYLTVHSADIDESVDSLHPAVPYRTGELLVKREIIQKGLILFIDKGLIKKVFTSSGIEYKATEYASHFIDSLEESYFLKLNEKAKWTVNNFSKFSNNDLKEFMIDKLNKIENEFNIEVLQ